MHTNIYLSNNLHITYNLSLQIAGLAAFLGGDEEVSDTSTPHNTAPGSLPTIIPFTPSRSRNEKDYWAAYVRAIRYYYSD